MTIGHTLNRLSNKVDIIAVSFFFLTHIEWSCGNAYYFYYLQISVWNFNIGLVNFWPEPANWFCQIISLYATF